MYMYSTALISDVGLCEDLHHRLCKLLLMSALSVVTVETQGTFEAGN